MVDYSILETLLIWLIEHHTDDFIPHFPDLYVLECPRLSPWLFSLFCLHPILRCLHSFPWLYIPLIYRSLPHFYFLLLHPWARLLHLAAHLISLLGMLNFICPKGNSCFPVLCKPTSPFLPLSKRHQVVQAKIQKSSWSFSFPHLHPIHQVLPILSSKYIEVTHCQKLITQV